MIPAIWSGGDCHGTAVSISPRLRVYCPNVDGTIDYRCSGCTACTWIHCEVVFIQSWRPSANQFHDGKRLNMSWLFSSCCKIGLTLVYNSFVQDLQSLAMISENATNGKWPSNCFLSNVLTLYSNAGSANCLLCLTIKWPSQSKAPAPFFAHLDLLHTEGFGICDAIKYSTCESTVSLSNWQTISSSGV